MLKAIIFDFDGVLIDDYEDHYKIYSKKYKNIDREKHKQLFEGNVAELRKTLEIQDPSIDVPNELMKIYQSVPFKKTIVEALKILKEKYQLFIITTNKETAVKKILENQKLNDIFDKILGIETNSRKDIKFKKILQDYKLEKTELVFITDTLGDIYEAHKLGIKTIAVDFGFHGRERLQKGNPLAIVSSFEEVLEIIQNIVSKNNNL